MLLGFNMLLWATQLTEAHFPWIEKIRETGYDGVELPIFAGKPEDYVAVGRAVKDNGLRATAVCIMPGVEQDCTSADPRKRQAGLDHIKWAIDCLEAAGGEVLCGPFHQPLGIFTGEPPTEEERHHVAETHKQAAAYAARAGIMLAIEPLNRFECYIYNTVGDTAALVRAVDEPNYGLLYDTFHSNIEEKDPVGVIAPNIGAIAHVHLSENDRGTPGKGHVPWAATLKALKSAGYDRWCTIEAFGRALPDLAAATRVWRDLSASPEEVYRFGHDFLRAEWAKA